MTKPSRVDKSAPTQPPADPVQETAGTGDARVAKFWEGSQVIQGACQ